LTEIVTRFDLSVRSTSVGAAPLLKGDELAAVATAPPAGPPSSATTSSPLTSLFVLGDVVRDLELPDNDRILRFLVRKPVT
jgi:hypothetical protein